MNMMKRIYAIRSAGAWMLAASIAMVGCVNSDYDFDKIDTVMGFGSDSIILPGSYTNVIELGDVLELKEGGNVVVEDNGDYVFKLAAGDVESAHPMVNPVSVKSSTAGIEFDMSFSSSAKSSALRKATALGTVSLKATTVATFDCTGHADEVKEVKSAEISGARLSLTLDIPSEMKACASTISNVTFHLPAYLSLSSLTSGNGQASISGSDIILTNVSTSKSINVSVAVSSLDFTGGDDAYGSLTVSGGDIELKGSVVMEMTFTPQSLPSSQSGGTVDFGKVKPRLTLGDFSITSARGRFAPSITFANLGETDVTGVPDFLEDGRVVADVDNPQVILSVASDLGVPSIIERADIVSLKDGAALATVSISDLHLKPSATTTVCVCRKATDALRAAYDEVKEVPALASLIRTIPDHVKIVNVVAKADDSQEAEFTFGHRYELKPSFQVNAPLAFGPEAVIVYNDTLDRWNDDIESLDVSWDASIEVTADFVSCLPLALHAEAKALSKGHLVNNGVDVEVSPSLIAASDGTTPVTTPVTIKVTERLDDAFQQLDGLLFTLTGSSSEAVQGVTLNAKKHTVKLDNIKVTVKGRIVGDLN